MLWEEPDDQAHPRNTNLQRIKEIGRATLKVESGYHRHSLVETTMFRLKTVFGDPMNAREDQRQKTEVRIKCVALNRMTRSGMPDRCRVI